MVKEPDPQETVLQDTVNTVNVTRPFKNPENEFKTRDEHEALSRAVTLDILSILKDDKSRGFYLAVARGVPSQVIYQLLAEIRADIINNPPYTGPKPRGNFYEANKRTSG